MSFTKLDPGIIDSSIWGHPPDIRVVWITLLAKCDADGYARLSLSGLQRAANVPMESVTNAIAVLESPDPDSRTAAEEGRRIRKIEGGWHVINYDTYRQNAQKEAVREYFSSQKKRQREKVSKTCPGLSVDSSASASVQGKGVQGERDQDTIFSLPVHLDTPRMRDEWKIWQEQRRGMKKPKSWSVLFNAQVKFLSTLTEPEAFESLSSSIRNGWQGIFRPKNNGQSQRPKSDKPF